MKNILLMLSLGLILTAFCSKLDAQTSPCEEELTLTSPVNDFHDVSFYKGAISVLTASNSIENATGEYVSENLIFLDEGFRVIDSDFMAHITEMCLISSAAEVYVASETVVNYPNPFSESTTIQFTLSKAVDVSIELYNSSGRLCDVIQQPMPFDKGIHRIEYRATKLPSGTYYYKIIAGQGVTTGRMILLR
jgi:hypothetical protein